MKSWILAGATLLLMQGADARENWGPPRACPKPKVDCCRPKPCCPAPAPKPCCPAPAPAPCAQPECPKPCCPAPSCDPCCPPVCFERGHATSSCCTPTAYSEWAAISNDCGWDVNINASFIYWEVMQGGMDLAIPGEVTAIVATPVITPPVAGQQVLQQGFEFEPGFKVGIGWTGGDDHWALNAEYTWLHSSVTTSSAAPAPGVASIAGVAVPQVGIWIPSSWFSSVYANNATTFISSHWKYGLDILDGQVSRPFYSGARLIMEPFFGLRGAWISQHMNLTANNLTGGTHRSASYHSSASAVGPRAGFNSNWFLGYGFRFMGNASASLLYTGYDVTQNVQTPDGAGATGFPISTQIENFHSVRPNVDMSLGFGWGSYFRCRRFHWDLSATYDFNIFWEQNMMRYLADLTEFSHPASGTATSITGHSNGQIGDLYIQGFTIKTQFDF